MGALLLGRLSFCFCLSVVAIQGKSFVVKRSISIPSSNEGYSKEDHPIISSFHVNSNIEFRYARTTVESHVHNPSNRSQEVAFIVTIPNSAFISNFSMVNDGVEYVAEVAAKEEANKVYQEAVTAGRGAGLVAQDVKYSNKFTVSTNVEPQEKVVFKMTYEELLQRKLGWYEHVINVNPGQAVNNLSIDVNIDESLPLSKLSVPELKMSNDIDFEPGQENKIAQVEWEQGNATASIKFAPSKEQQEEYGEQGLAGQLLVKYDVERDDKDNEIQVIDGYFVHFFTPDPENLKTLPKHIIFVLDISGSMSGEKILQVKDAMFTILDDMTDQDYFNIMTFSSSFNHWKLPSKEHLAHFLPNLHSFELIEASPENRRQAIQYINTINASGGTNINEALLEGLKLAGEAKKNEALPTNLQSIVVFLSDGEPTSGVTDVNDIKNNVKEANIQVQVPIYSLGFGKGADFNFIRDISTDSGAFAKHIYEDSDAALQLEDFLAEIASPLLSDLKFNYVGDLVDDNSISEKHLSTFYKGGEFVITGKLKNTPQENDTMEVTVSAVGENGTAYDHKTSICWRSAPMPGDNNITDISDDPFERNCSLTYSPIASPRYSQAQKFLKHLYAYLNIKQLCKKIDKHISGPNPSKEKALRLSLEYNFVTNLTSLVVAKPVEDVAKEVLEEEIEQDVRNSNRFIASQSYYDYDGYDLHNANSAQSSHNNRNNYQSNIGLSSSNYQSNTGLSSSNYQSNIGLSSSNYGYDYYSDYDYYYGGIVGSPTQSRGRPTMPTTTTQKPTTTTKKPTTTTQKPSSCILEMFSKTYYRGEKISVTGDNAELGGFDDKVVSIRVKGNCCWRLFSLVDYQGDYEDFREGEYRSPQHIGKMFREASSVQKLGNC